VNYLRQREKAQEQLLEVLPHLFRRLLVSLPNEVEGLARVTPEQFAMLSQILDHGALTMSELASGRGIALNTATSLVDRLVTAGLAERRGDASDRRVVRVVTTPRGARLVQELRAVRHRLTRQMLDELADDEVDGILSAIPALARLAGLAAATPAAR
jgi:DNA-binding MarR family transcriptional regulator